MQNKSIINNNLNNLPNKRTIFIYFFFAPIVQSILLEKYFFLGSQEQCVLSSFQADYSGISS